MAIRDLLWACPCCGARGGVRPARRRGVEACRACGTSFRRGRGAQIIATREDGGELVRHAESWAGSIGAPRPEHLAPNDAGEILRDRAIRRRALRQAPVRRHGDLIGFREIYEAPEIGTLVLTPESLRFLSESGAAEAWPFDEIHAVSASSTAFQVRVAGPLLCAYRFPDSSLRLWEEHLCLALREHYRRTGRGEIAEFQPRITA